MNKPVDTCSQHRRRMLTNHPLIAFSPWFGEPVWVLTDGKKVEKVSASRRSRTNRDSFPAGDQLDIAPDPHSWATNQPIAHSAGSLIREPFAVARQEAALSDR